MNIEDKPKFYYAVENFPEELKDYFRDELQEEYDEYNEPRIDWNDLD